MGTLFLGAGHIFTISSYSHICMGDSFPRTLFLPSGDTSFLYRHCAPLGPFCPTPLHLCDPRSPSPCSRRLFHSRSQLPQSRRGTEGSLGRRQPKTSSGRGGRQTEAKTGHYPPGSPGVTVPSLPLLRKRGRRRLRALSPPRLFGQALAARGEP